MRTFAQKPKATQQSMFAKSLMPGPVHPVQNREVHSILHLQRTIGNQAVQRLLQSNAEELNAGRNGTSLPHFRRGFSRIPVSPRTAGAIQTKLAINMLGDEFEQEADRIASQVMRMPEQRLQRACACGGGCPKCQVQQLNPELVHLQTKHVRASNTGQVAVPPIVRDVIQSPGQPLEPPTRAFMETHFGRDFSQGRVHADAKASESARAVNALAYSVGQHVVFGAGQYTPNSKEGRRLLAHELTHVVQQGEVQGSPALVQREPIEEYAREMAKQRRWLREAALELAKGPTKSERVLEFVGKWGRNASPFNIAMTYVRLNWQGVSYWADVRKSAKAGRTLLKRIDGLERGARALKKAADELYAAEAELPGYPLRTAEEIGHAMVSEWELEYVEKYYNTAAKIANEAMSTRSELRKAIAGWDAVVEQADKNSDFTRASAWDAINDLNLRFDSEGGDFRAYLVNARDRADTVESWARSKQYHAADILGKWTPAGYQPPAGPI